MKRNRLIKPSHRADLLAYSPSKWRGRHIMLLAAVSFIGISVTSLVLATNKPVSNSIQSQRIALPDLASDNPLNSLTPLPQYHETTTVSSAVQPIAKIATELVTNDNDASAHSSHEAELTLLEQQKLASPESGSVPLAETTDSAVTWHTISVQSGDNLSVIFQRVGLSAREVYQLSQLGSEITPLLSLKPGQTLRIATRSEQKISRLAKLQLQLSPLETLHIASSVDGYQVSTDLRTVETRQTQVSGEISSSLFAAGIAAGLTDKMVMELAYIFGWDIDFALDLRAGDSFMVIYSEDYLDGKKIADGAILAAEFTNRGNTYRSILYTDPSGLARYYTPNGESMRKTFSRSPVHFSRISSKFSLNRKHPVLKINRPHRGVDYAAATGTPITATGDGKVSFIGNKGGYGRTVILSHGGKYTTLYAHMSRYKKGLKKGSRIQQGEVIGYVGSSGVSTGPHLHYEFRVHGVHRNPLTVTLPKAKPLAKQYLADFKQKAAPFIAQLDKMSATTLLAVHD